jgi:quinolinate synthase
VFEIPVKASEFNEGDVFVLDTGLKIYYWAGNDCNIHEKFKALEIANNIKENERHSKAVLLYPRDV